MMNSKGVLFIIAISSFMGMVAPGQAPEPTALKTGPGVQAPADAKYRDYVTANCKAPPVMRGRGPGRGAQPPTHDESGFIHREYTVGEIPGVIAGGQRFRSIWKGTENNADGMVGLNDGSLLVAQNSNS